MIIENLIKDYPVKKIYVSLICFTVLAFCLIQLFTKNSSMRKIASANDYDQNIKILNSIPLLKGAESQSRSEARIAETLIEIFNKIENEAVNTDGSLNRGTHAKGRCFMGNFKVFSNEELKNEFHYSDELITHLKQGIFATSGESVARLRFANAKGAKNPDTVPDVKGFSFSFESGMKNYRGTYQQDFMLNSTPMFAVNNIKEFLELMKTARLAGGDFDYFPNPFYLKAVLRAKKLLDQYERADTKSYASEEYWTNLPYSHGKKSDGTPADVVKFKTTPCDGLGIQHESSAGKQSNYLQEDIIKRSLDGKVCFLFQMQLFNLNKMNTANAHSTRTVSDWVENGGELWDDALLPFYTIAKIEVKKKTDSAGNSVTQEISCANEFFNTRLHSNSYNQPLGSIARVRTLVEENSRARRMKEN